MCTRLSVVVTARAYVRVTLGPQYGSRTLLDYVWLCSDCLPERDGYSFGHRHDIPQPIGCDDDKLIVGKQTHMEKGGLDGDLRGKSRRELVKG